MLLGAFLPAKKKKDYSLDGQKKDDIDEYTAS